MTISNEFIFCMLTSYVPCVHVNSNFCSVVVVLLLGFKDSILGFNNSILGFNVREMLLKSWSFECIGHLDFGVREK